MSFVQLFAVPRPYSAGLKGVRTPPAGAQGMTWNYPDKNHPLVTSFGEILRFFPKPRWIPG